MKTKPDIDLITLGCSKNLVDSERLMGMLEADGFTVRHDPADGSAPAPVVVINTCGFISDAKEESIDTILGYGRHKSSKKPVKIIVMGCLSERYRNELPAEIPEVDAWFGKFDFEAVRNYINSNCKKQRPTKTNSYGRTVTTGPSNAYVKIAEGCDRFCAFCAIPLITGRYHSRTIEDITAEIRDLVSQGFTEFNIIAQDLSSYGKDIYGEKRLAELINSISAIEGVKWIRLHYAYPADFPYDILPVIRENPKVCSYLDIAFQHIADPVLNNMRRHFSGKETRELIEKIRREVPGIHIRTTLMVGFPGEGEAEFNELLDFVREARFERMGAFAYSEEDDTYAAKNFSDDIPDEVKQERLDCLMALQEQISEEVQASKVGKRMEVVIDREDDDWFVGRTEFDSPEVDPEVLISKTDSEGNQIKLIPGSYHTVEITQALPFELIAKIV